MYDLKIKIAAVGLFIIIVSSAQYHVLYKYRDYQWDYKGFGVKIDKSLRVQNAKNEDRHLTSNMNRNLKNVILTIFCTSKKDPQRKKFIPPTIKYMNNFYISAKILNLKVIIFHDNLTQKFVQEYATDKIKFKRITMHHKLSINDYRFLIFHDYLKSNYFSKILMVDISDVIFWGNPFDYMDEQFNHKLFVALDKGTFKSNKWMLHNFKRCYGKELYNLNYTVYNAGLWGGTGDVVKCMLNCIVSQLKYTSGMHYNCNMPVLNWCINNSNCSRDDILDDDPIFTNPFRSNCEIKYSVVHDKCKSSYKKCMVVANGTLHRITC